jgi:hypothetical protein
MEQKNFSLTIKSLATSDLNVAYGFAIISSENGEPYYDLHGDYIPDEVIVKVSKSFTNLPVFLQHNPTLEDGPVGRIVSSFPLTADIARSLGLNVEKTGLLVGVRIENESVLRSVKDGTLTGFSIGGYLRRVYV